MKTLEEIGISKSPWGTYPTKKEVAITTSCKGFDDLEAALCRGPNRKANACFIAASTDVYKCLCEATELMCKKCCHYNIQERKCYDGIECPKHDCVPRKWRAALAKAAGEEIDDGQ